MAGSPARSWAHKPDSDHATGVSKSIPDNLNGMKNPPRRSNGDMKLSPSGIDTSKDYPMVPGAKQDIPGYQPMSSTLNLHIHTGRDVLMDGQNLANAAAKKRRMKNAR